MILLPRGRCVLLCAGMILSGLLCAAEQAAELPQEAEVTIADEVHRKVSIRLSDLVGQVDQFFGDEEERPRRNESWARLRLDLRKQQFENPDLKANVKLKLVLPSTEKRFRLLLSTEEEDTGSASNAVDSSGTAEPDDGNVALALRFLRTLRENSGVKFDLGARILDSKPQVFVAVGAFYRAPIDDDWTGTITNNTVYYDESGYEERLSLKFERPIDRDGGVLFLGSTQFAWEEGQKGAVVSGTTGLYQQFSKQRSLASEFLLTFRTAPATGKKRFEQAGFRLRFRQNVWRRWFYYEIWPGVTWPAEQDYQAVYGAMLRLEAVFGSG